MQTNQYQNKSKIFRRATGKERFWAGCILAGFAGLFAVLWLAGRGVIDVGLILGPCGFQQRYELPCPTCGMTTAAIGFVQGRVFEVFYIQPAAGLLCWVLVVVGFLALLVAVFGVYFRFLSRFVYEVKIRYVIFALIIIIGCGWAVTLARALAKAKGV